MGPGVNGSNPFSAVYEVRGALARQLNVFSVNLLVYYLLVNR